MIVSHNLTAMNARRQYKLNLDSKRKSTEKLSSGYKINRAADDAAGLTISEKMRSQIRGLTKGVNNCQDGISLCQIADGALNEVNDMLHRVTELSVKSANGTNTEADRQAIQKEVHEVLKEIDRISNSTEFNTMPVFDGRMAGSAPLSKEELLGPLKAAPEKEKETLTYEEAYEQLKNLTYITADKDFDVPGMPMFPNGFDSMYLNMYITDLSSSVLISELYNSDILVYDHPQEAYDVLEKVAINELKATQFYIDEKGYDPTSYYLTNSPSKRILNSMDNIRKENIWSASMIYRYHDGGRPQYSNVTQLLSSFEYQCQQWRRYGDKVKIGTTGFELAQSFMSYGYDPAAYVTAYRTPHSVNAAVSDYQNIYALLMQGINDGFDEKCAEYEKYVEEYDGKYEKYLKSIAENDGVWIQAGARRNNGFSMYIDAMNSSVLGIKNIDVSTQDGALTAIDKVKDASAKVSKMRSKIGAQQNRLESTIRNEDNIIENTTAAESRIRDTDMANEMVELTKQNIIIQAGEAVMAQANQSKQGILTILNS